jgi:hypothetical protein
MTRSMEDLMDERCEDGGEILVCDFEQNGDAEVVDKDKLGGLDVPANKENLEQIRETAII